METLLHNLSEVFAVSIIHSLWQCLIIYLLLRIVLGSAIKFSSAAKYNIGVIALYYVTLWFVYTLFDQAKHYSWIIRNNTAFTAQPHLPLITTLKHFAQANDRYEITIEHYLPYITIAYVLGLIFHSLKLTSSWMQLRQLKQSTIENLQLQQMVDTLSKKLKLKKQVIIGYAEKIDIPCVAGYLKPLIMLPLSMTTYLSAKEIEAILLHELAHVKRNDYLVNLIQQVMSVIFFFNPFVYLINRMVNNERENSCDDIVVELTEEPLVYAQALLKIEQNNVVYMPLALAATGKKYHLLNRIERIMKTKNPTTNLRHLALAFTILLASTISLAWFTPAIGNGKLSVKSLKASMFFSHTDTTRQTRKIEKHTYIGPDHKAVTHKKVWVSKDGKNYYYNDGMSDLKLEALGKEMDAYGKQMDAYFNSPTYKRLNEEMEKSGKEIEAYYNAPEYKKLQEEMEKAGKDVESYYNSPALKKMIDEQKRANDIYASKFDGKQMDALSKQMEADGKIMSKWYDSKEFKIKAAELRKKYHVPAVYSCQEKDQDGNVKAYLQELKEYTPQNVAKAQENMKTLGNQMNGFYQTPAMQESKRRMEAMSDSMREAYSNPQIKAEQERLAKLGEQMRAYTNNAAMKQLQQQLNDQGRQMRAYTNSQEFKKLQQQMKAKGEEMRAYTNSPEFKRRAAEWQKNMNWDQDSKSSTNVNADEPPPVPEVNAPAPPPPPIVKPL